MKSSNLKQLIIGNLIIIIVLCISSFKQNERYFEKLASYNLHGIEQVRLKDNTIVDIVTDTFAIEVDFVNKWYESIGQSEYYALQLNKKPGIVIIIRNPSELKELNRITYLCIYLKINLWIIEAYNPALRRVLIY